MLALVPGNTDTPGLRSSSPRKGQEAWMRPEDVAAEALDALGSEPVHVCGEANQYRLKRGAVVVGEANRRVVAALDRMPRAERLRVMGESTRSLYED